jgi:hypothetical protein
MSSKDLPYEYVMGRISPNEYWQHILQTFSVLTYTKGCPGLADNVVNTLTDLFWELNGLERNDPLWDRTNKLATIYKLGDFARHRLQSGGDRAKYSWALIAYGFATGADPPAIELWKALAENGALDIDVLVRTTMNGELATGVEKIEYLFKAAYELGIVDEINAWINNPGELDETERRWVAEFSNRLNTR